MNSRPCKAQMIYRLKIKEGRILKEEPPTPEELDVQFRRVVKEFAELPKLVRERAGLGAFNEKKPMDKLAREAGGKSKSPPPTTIDDYDLVKDTVRAMALYQFISKINLAKTEGETKELSKIMKAAKRLESFLIKATERDSPLTNSPVQTQGWVNARGEAIDIPDVRDDETIRRHEHLPVFISIGEIRHVLTALHDRAKTIIDMQDGEGFFGVGRPDALDFLVGRLLPACLFQAHRAQIWYWRPWV